MKRYRRSILALVVTGAMLAGLLTTPFIRPAHAIDLGDILLLGGIVLVVSTFGSQINDFINNALGQREVELAGASKVVPIFSVGRGIYVGAAQVVGLPVNVRRTQGVAALDVQIGQVDGTGLVPISTRSATGTSLNRVAGVGVSAIIDFRL